MQCTGSITAAADYACLCTGVLYSTKQWNVHALSGAVGALPHWRSTTDCVTRDASVLCAAVVTNYHVVSKYVLDKSGQQVMLS
jgi:hypothetical protein